MRNDEAQRVLSNLLAEAAVRSLPVRPTEQMVAELLARLSFGKVETLSAPIPSGSATGKTNAEGNPEGSMVQLSRHLVELAAAARNQAETLEENTRAVIENSLVRAGESKGSTAGSVAKTALSFLGNGLGLVRVFGRLFGGGGEAPQPELTRYTLPPSVEWTAALTGGGILPLHYGQDGSPRATPAPTAPTPVPITIQVQAMDSRSFLDHSSDIAKAVKDALLRSHTLTDVVADL